MATAFSSTFHQQIWFLNINGGISNSPSRRATPRSLKWLQGKVQATQRSRLPIAICLCETKLKPTDPEPTIIGYRTYRLDHVADLQLRAHGGVIIFVKNEFSFVKRYLEHSTSSVEALGLDIFERRRSARGGKVTGQSGVGQHLDQDGIILRVICYYRRPKSDRAVFLSWLEEVLGNTMSATMKNRVILAGDANINMDEVTKVGQNSTLVVESLKQIIDKCGFQQLVTEVTREGIGKWH